MKTILNVIFVLFTFILTCFEEKFGSRLTGQTVSTRRGFTILTKKAKYAIIEDHLTLSLCKYLSKIFVKKLVLL